MKTSETATKVNKKDKQATMFGAGPQKLENICIVINLNSYRC